MSSPPPHKHMDHRERVAAEGDDCLHERCARCGAVRLESDSDRPMLWFVDPSNPTGFRYAYPDPKNASQRDHWSAPTTNQRDADG